MSAPRTNVETQERRHKPVLIFLRVVIVGALVALLGFAVLQMTGDAPDGDAFGEDGTFEAGGQGSAAVD
jgi:multisubunit Na+/H+ antiporter MnhB subunit